jgi:frataxin-like iron-binding protein CyaY
LQERLEAADIDNAFENDISFSGDVLQLKTERGQTWVLNKHNVTRQIWLSSPLSGPSKYNYHAAAAAAVLPADAANVAAATAAASTAAVAGATGAAADTPGGRWLSERDDTTALSAVLSGEFARVFSVAVKFNHEF